MPRQRGDGDAAAVVGNGERTSLVEGLAILCETRGETTCQSSDVRQ